ncbi:MAG TPA: IPT/TIG domain-containing protein [Xanthobacteraceae bacterium]|nr:IPT/TIG domain-containing protein [Xanthobacteraceae bacterium]
MIILPDRNIARAKYLMPMHRRAWQSPGKHIHFQTWIAQAYRADHSMVWQGHFEDREDADEFMWAIATGNIRQDKYLQRLPIYCPDFDPRMLDDPSIGYNLVSNIGIGGGSGWGVPGDCSGIFGRAGEFVDVIGGGGSGTARCMQSAGNATGGGGGAFARIYYGGVYAPGSTVPLVVGGGGGGVAAGQYSTANGNGGGYTSWNNNQALAYGGNGGVSSNYPNAAGSAAGGNADAGAGAVRYHGGRSGSGNVTSSGSGGTGGGGAGGPGGGGNIGGDTASTGAQPTAGGSGGGGGGGAGGGPAGANTAGPSGQGGEGYEYGPWGSGGGSGGLYSSIGNGSSGRGGYYGGGSGGVTCVTSNATTGAGGQGLIVVRYEQNAQVVVSSCSPNVGHPNGGTAVTIGGSGFDRVTNVTIGGNTASSIGVPNANTITCNTPAGTPGTLAHIQVTASSGYTSGIGYNLFNYVPLVAVNSCSPSGGTSQGGQLVTISGSGFVNVQSVTIGGNPATGIGVPNANTITCYTPAGVPGSLAHITVVASGGLTSSTGYNLYSYAPLPAVYGCSPPLGSMLGGTPVTISGANFVGITNVTFGGVGASAINVVNANTITCNVPAHALGLVDITVYGQGNGTGAGLFTYVRPSAGFNMPMMGI